MDITDRQKNILCAIVDAFIEIGEPVGSKALTEQGFSYSSATIRSEMSELSEMGFLTQPHTSAGRIPSQRGLRYYVDNIMHKRSLSRDEMNTIDSLLADAVKDPIGILNDVSLVLAELTKLVALSTSMAAEDAVIRRVEIIPTGKRTVLIVLMTNSGIVKNKQVKTDVDTGGEFVSILTKVLNDRLSNLPVSNITLEFIKSFAVSLGEFAFVISAILLAILEAAKEAGQPEIALEGQTNLLFRPEFEQDEIREIISFLNHKEDINKIVSRYEFGSRVLIGRELEQKELEHSALITARYQIDGKTAGTIGVIGPQRMDYAKMISSIEYFASSISRMLTEGQVE